MQFIRRVAHSRRAPGLTVQQFRALGYVCRRPGACLSDLALHLGLTLPTVSRLIDGLVGRGLMYRRPLPDNRRQVRLTVRPRGAKLMEAAFVAVLEQLESRLHNLTVAKRNRLVASLRDLRGLFE
jgi:DNA-binding MarR family transcriptional regulator